MKNLTKLLVVAMVVGLTACASDEETANRNYRYAGEDGCGDALIKEKPAPAPGRQVAQLLLPSLPPVLAAVVSRQNTQLELL